jgi:hypothetical protein
VIPAAGDFQRQNVDNGPNREPASAMSSSNGPKDDTKPKVGRVRHDSSGRAIWEWATETGKHAMDSTSRLLKRLELPGLSILEDPKDKAKEDDKGMFGGPKEADPLKGRQSFNPYETKAPPRIQAPPPSARPAPKPATNPAATAPPKPAAPPPRPLTQAEQEAETRIGPLGRLFGRKK